MTRRNQWRVVVAIWIITILLWLSTCEPAPDIEIVGIEEEVPGKTSGIDKPLVLHAIGRGDTDDQELHNWAAKQCRKHLVLPPVEAAPVIQRLTADAQTGRQPIRITCYRDKWSVPE